MCLMACVGQKLDPEQIRFDDVAGVVAWFPPVLGESSQKIAKICTVV